MEEPRKGWAIFFVYLACAALAVSIGTLADPTGFWFLASGFVLIGSSISGGLLILD